MERRQKFLGSTVAGVVVIAAVILAAAYVLGPSVRMRPQATAGAGQASGAGRLARAGNQIAFASFRDGNWEIYVMHADGSNPTRLTHDSGFRPAW